MGKRDYIFTEENGIYCINCENAIWATDKIHDAYQTAKIHINDVDFIIENENCLILVEYKNANIQGASKPEAFAQNIVKNIPKIARKYYDSLHYLRLLNKTKQMQYICVFEYPNDDQLSRKKLRNMLKEELPFELQKNVGNDMSLISKVDILSIEEWNRDPLYGKYPFTLKEKINK